MRDLYRPLLLVALALLPVGFLTTACDKATPVAPTDATLTVSASPSEITSTTGTSTITAVVRKANGQPVNPGTQVRFTTTLGTIDPVVATDSSGVATATLRGDGRLGTAKVSASTGAVKTDPMDVIIGTAAKTITLQANPTTLPATGGTVSLLAIVRDTRGTPLAGESVNFTTPLGRLGSGGRIIQTNSLGEARDTLTLSAEDLSNSPTQVAVSANAVGSDGALVSATFNVQIVSGVPVASFTYARGSSGANSVRFTSTSTGTSLTYLWDFGDATATATGQTVEHTYATPGTYTVTLIVTSSTSGRSATASGQITVPVTTGGTIQ